VVVNERGFNLRLRQVLDDTLLYNTTGEARVVPTNDKLRVWVSVLCIVPMNGTLRIH
jgi:hypothetical protein